MLTEFASHDWPHPGAAPYSAEACSPPIAHCHCLAGSVCETVKTEHSMASDDCRQINADKHFIPLSEVPALDFMPKRKSGRKLYVSTIYRWRQRGRRGRKLKTFAVGGTRCTTI